MTDVHIVVAECGDYYCNAEHLVGIYTTPELADAAKAVAEASVTVHLNHDPDTRSTPLTWESVEVQTITLDEMPAPRVELGVPR